MGLFGGEALGGFEPLAVLVDEGDEGDGGVADLGGELNEFVVVLLGEGVEQLQGAEGVKPILFVHDHRFSPRRTLKLT